jgi:histone H3-like centromeric protein A
MGNSLNKIHPHATVFSFFLFSHQAVYCIRCISSPVIFYTQKKKKMARTVQTEKRSSDKKEKVEKSAKPAKEKKSATGAKKATPSKEKKKVSKDEVVRKKRKFHPGTVALREIKRFQKNADSLIQKMPMKRLIREISEKEADSISEDYGMFLVNIDGVRWTKKAMEELCESAEMFLTRLFAEANNMCVHSKRMTVRPEDIMMALRSNTKHRLIYKSYLENKNQAVIN